MCFCCLGCHFIVWFFFCLSSWCFWTKHWVIVTQAKTSTSKQYLLQKKKNKKIKKKITIKIKQNEMWWQHANKYHGITLLQTNDGSNLNNPLFACCGFLFAYKKINFLIKTSSKRWTMICITWFIVCKKKKKKLKVNVISRGILVSLNPNQMCYANLQRVVFSTAKHTLITLIPTKNK